MAPNLKITDAELRRRQRVRNAVMLIVLVALAALFYSIAIVKFRVS